MKFMYLGIMLCILTQINFYCLKAMEGLERADSFDKAHLKAMHDLIGQSSRVGKIGTLILGDAINQSYYETIKNEITAHQFIKTQEVATNKSYSFNRYYNPFIIKGLYENNDTPLAKAFLLTLTNGFKTQSATNDLNDAFFESDDKLKGFTQVDYCTSAKYMDETFNSFTYIARFFNKEALLHAINIFAPTYISLQEKSHHSHSASDSSENK